MQSSNEVDIRVSLYLLYIEKEGVIYMSNLLASFNAGVSGLRSAQASLNTTSHNIANAHTPGYTRQQTVVTDSFYQNTLGAHNNMLQVGMGTVIVDTRQIRITGEFKNAVL